MSNIALAENHPPAVNSQVIGATCGQTPIVTVILSLPQGTGKTALAEQLAKQLRCGRIVDEWAPGKPIYAGALHLTNVSMTPGARL